MLSQYLLFTVIKERLVNTSVSANVLKVYSLRKYGQEALFADILISAYGQFDVWGKNLCGGTCLWGQSAICAVVYLRVYDRVLKLEAQILKYAFRLKITLGQISASNPTEEHLAFLRDPSDSRESSLAECDPEYPNVAPNSSGCFCRGWAGHQDLVHAASGLGLAKCLSCLLEPPLVG